MIDETVGLVGTNVSVGQAESTIMEKFINAGFNVVDPEQVKGNITRDKALRILEGDNAAAAAEGLKYGAQVVITGKAFSKIGGSKLYGTNMQSVQATLQARVVRTDTAKVFASKSATGAQVHIDELQGGALAIKEASEKLSDDLIQLIVKQWAAGLWPLSGDNSDDKRPCLLQAPCCNQKFLEKETQGVKAVHQRSFWAVPS